MPAFMENSVRSNMYRLYVSAFNLVTVLKYSLRPCVPTQNSVKLQQSLHRPILMSLLAKLLLLDKVLIARDALVAHIRDCQK